MAKSQDEFKALQLCQTKVRQKKLPMDVVDAEYQWWASFFFLRASMFPNLF
jgi:cell fate regulator YaaT (PSP1 superfamily)